MEAQQVSVSQTPGLAEPCHRIAIIGAGAGGRSAHAALQAAGITEVAMLDHEVLRARFHDDTDT